MNETGKRVNILIVDDMPQNIQVVANMLQAEGYQMAFARDGQTALRHTESQTFDLILLDIMMPGMDGYEVCAHLQAEPATQAIPIIFLTAKTETDAIVRGFKTGAVDYVTKPFKAAELLARVKIHLALKRAREKIEEQNKELLEAARLREDVERITRHDLKTPLNIVIGFPPLIREEEDLSEHGVRHLRMIEEAGYRMLNMINLSLDLFKMERGIYQSQPVPVNIADVLFRITIETRTLAQQKELTVDVFLDDRPADDEEVFSVMGENLLCYSMLANLIKNAIEASPEGAQVTVRLTEEEESIIRIHNQGVVPEAIQARFFEKYVTSGKEKQGTGLGTYSAKLIAETQHGSITMASSEHEGTTVTIRLPKDIRVQEASARKDARPDHREAHALIVPPSQDDLATLSQLALIGDILGIEEYVNTLQDQDHTYAPFASRILTLRDAVQILEIREFIKQFIEK